MLEDAKPIESTELTKINQAKGLAARALINFQTALKQAESVREAVTFPPTAGVGRPPARNALIDLYVNLTAWAVETPITHWQQSRRRKSGHCLKRERGSS